MTDIASVRKSTIRRTALLLAALICIILVAPVFAPYSVQSPIDIPPINNQAPSLQHVMGTDKLDVDLFSLVLTGCQTSLTIALSATAIALAVGLAYGAFAAFAGGAVDSLLMRITDISFSIPRFLVLLAISSILNTALSTPKLVVLIGLTGWFDVARITRGEIAGLITRDWILAARAGGVGTVRIALRHILPHLVPILTVMATLGIGHTIVLEAGLMFLGVGSSEWSLGHLLQNGAGIAARSRWWLTVFPGLAIVLIVFACNALGDALRDVFAPEQVHAWPTT